MLDNLVNNALRYSRQSISIRVGQQGDWGYLQVDDDGPGIPAAERERIFEPFVRLDPSRDRTTGGCGLGLAIVHSIALAYGGEISVGESHLGGARFLFRWPLKPAASYLHGWSARFALGMRCWSACAGLGLTMMQAYCML